MNTIENVGTGLANVLNDITVAIRQLARTPKVVTVPGDWWLLNADDGPLDVEPVAAFEVTEDHDRGTVLVPLIVSMGNTVARWDLDAGSPVRLVRGAPTPEEMLDLHAFAARYAFNNAVEMARHMGCRFIRPSGSEKTTPLAVWEHRDAVDDAVWEHEEGFGDYVDRVYEALSEWEAATGVEDVALVPMTGRLRSLLSATSTASPSTSSESVVGASQQRTAGA